MKAERGDAHRAVCVPCKTSRPKSSIRPHTPCIKYRFRSCWHEHSVFPLPQAGSDVRLRRFYPPADAGKMGEQPLRLHPGAQPPGRVCGHPDRGGHPLGAEEIPRAGSGSCRGRAHLGLSPQAGLQGGDRDHQHGPADRSRHEPELCARGG